MKELAVSFGNNNSLFGIITSPDDAISKKDVMVIILNSGMLHKVGAFRFSVRLARHLAESEYQTLRFDLSGKGDSVLTGLNNPDEDRVVRDVQYAMSYVEKTYHIDKFILMGLCSGADDSHKVAISDERVVGTVLIDGHAYINFKYKLFYYLTRMLTIKKWNRIYSYILNVTNNGKNNKNQFESNALPRVFPPKETVEKQLQKLADRGVSLLYIFTGGVSDYYNYKKQFFDNFKDVNFRGLLEHDYYPYADHTLYNHYDKKQVIGRISSWVKRNFNECQKTNKIVD